jgi:WD40 repeat protein
MNLIVREIFGGKISISYNGQAGIECAQTNVFNPNLYPPSNSMTMSPDGTKVFAVLHNGNNEGFTRDSVIQFNLSTAWDLTTMSTQIGGTPSLNSFPSYSEQAPTGAFFSPDGLNLYVCGQTFNRVYRYTLSTAYTPSTATAHSSFATGLTVIVGLTFSQDGTYMFITGTSSLVTRFLLSTAWDVTSASTNGSTKTITGTSIYFTPDGLNLYSFGGGGLIKRYNLATAWDLGSTTIETSSSNIGTIPSIGNIGAFRGIHLSADGKRFFFSNYVGVDSPVKAVDFSKAFQVTGKF